VEGRLLAPLGDVAFEFALGLGTAAGAGGAGLPEEGRALEDLEGHRDVALDEGVDQDPVGQGDHLLKDPVLVFEEDARPLGPGQGAVDGLLGDVQGLGDLLVGLAVDPALGDLDGAQLPQLGVVQPGVARVLLLGQEGLQGGMREGAPFSRPPGGLRLRRAPGTPRRASTRRPAGGRG
jgi:hypothetical protein